MLHSPFASLEEADYGSSQRNPHNGLIARPTRRPRSIELCRDTRARTSTASGKFGLERLGHGTAAAEPGGNSGERRHHDHGPRHHGEPLPERRKRGPGAVAAGDRVEGGDQCEASREDAQGGGGG